MPSPRRKPRGRSPLAPSLLSQPPQTLVYNHGLLTLWHEHAVAAMLDVDEYLMTPHKGATLEQARELPPAPEPRTHAAVP